MSLNFVFLDRRQNNIFLSTIFLKYNHSAMEIKKKLISLFEKWAEEKMISFEDLPESGSYRKYFRIKSETKTAIGAFNNDKKENRAYIEFSKCFLNHQLHVPEILANDIENDIYLVEDLGDETLFTFISNNRNEELLTQEIISIYKKVLTELPKFQIHAGKDIDYSICYPRNSFDSQSMLWDLNYFKYYFLKLAKISFDEQKLEDDFITFSNYLLNADCSYFLYRDFQSRNIMLKDDNVYFIDFQGGRKGALQYDVASLLYDAKANIPQDARTELLNYYISVLKNHISVDAGKFTEHYYGYVYIRIMQALGAYGFRGFYEKKEHFLQSIPFALENIRWLLKNIKLPIEIPVLMDVMKQIVESEWLSRFKAEKPKLTVTINSFSYKKGIPSDSSGNGGGFVFDCRSLPNPGRYESYMSLNGKDEPVIRYLEGEPETGYFFVNVCRIIDQSVENYIKRDFSNLMVNFGCTGGQHRSVFFAEKLKKYLINKFDIQIVINHTEQNSWT
jgi:aminoglycoside/choline kinase family phosphotransferase